ncbi:MAG: oligosaccharide flippase family protein [Actinomycetia bacterium]|nr:oligosaccharide flippase family protein [Actinomycetes bacterium]
MEVKDDYKRVAKNSIFLYILTFSNYLLGLLLYPYLSRTLSVSYFGLFGFSMVFATIIQVVIEYGFMISATASISKNRDNGKAISNIMSDTLFAKILLFGLALTVFLTIAWLLPMVKSNFMIVLLFFINGALTAFIPDYYFRGIEKMKAIAIRTIIIRAASYTPVLIFIQGDSDLMKLPLFLAAGNLLALFVTYALIYKDGVRFCAPRVKRAICLIKESFFFFLSRFAASINSSLGSFVLGLSYAPASLQVGLFAGCSKLSSACEMMLSPVSDSIYPHMVHKKDYGLLKKVLIGGTIIWLAVMVMAFIFAEAICAIILGAEYAAAGKYLRILLIGSFFGFPTIMLGYPALTPIGKENHANISLCIGSIAMILACLILYSTDSINLVSICCVVISSNIINTLYRGSALIRYRKVASAVKGEGKSD